MWFFIQICDAMLGPILTCLRPVGTVSNGRYFTICAGIFAVSLTSTKSCTLDTYLARSLNHRRSDSSPPTRPCPQRQARTPLVTDLLNRLCG